jgi:hypothetical protein
VGYDDFFQVDRRPDLNWMEEVTTQVADYFVD